jgi:hypothetical protein
VGPVRARRPGVFELEDEIARELAQSVLWHRLLITGDPITDDLVVQLVDEVLVPFVSPGGP